MNKQSTKRYEVPAEIKQLYNHWEYHMLEKESPKADMDKLSEDLFSESIFAEIVDFASERMHVWYKKYSGATLPYTQDPILADFRFCNIYRELDRQTIEIHSSLEEFKDDDALWLLNLMLNRFLCKPETYKKIGSLSLDKENNKNVYKRLLDLPNPKYGSAYVFPISVIQRTAWPTRESFFTQYLPRKVEALLDKIRTFDRIGVSEALPQVLEVFGFNFKFHFTEILIDVAYKFPEHIDLNKQFPIGPGSMPTMKRVNAKQDPEITNLELSKVKISEFPYLEINGKPVYLSAENWEGIGCEFRKYTNLKAGKGRRRKFS